VKSHLAILLWATDPDLPHQCATPFFIAATAAAMDVEVEVHFSSKSVLLLVDGLAAGLYAGIDRQMSVYQHMQQAARAGARFYACSDAVAAHGLQARTLVPEMTGVAGAAAFAGRALDDQWTALIF
jgi:uncharacterized protein